MQTAASSARDAQSHAHSEELRRLEAEFAAQQEQSITALVQQQVASAQVQREGAAEIARLTAAIAPPSVAPLNTTFGGVIDVVTVCATCGISPPIPIPLDPVPDQGIGQTQSGGLILHWRPSNGHRRVLAQVCT